LNPGSHAPQACILIQSSKEFPKIHGFSLLLDDGPAFQDYNTKIIKTLDELLANGKKMSTRRSAFYCLRQMNREVDLMNPEAVKKWIGAKQSSDPTKQKLANAYEYFTQSNGLEWEKPVYKYDSKVPITPNKEQAEAIISSSPSLNMATIFRILLESGFEGQELRNCTEKDVDTEQGVITVAGNKGHRGRKYKFKSSTAEMLRVYMHKHRQEHPFPRPQVMGEAWRLARERAAEKLSRPDLKKIPLKGLRNLSGILLWEKCRDPWIVMLHMGHKKLDTTQHYLSAMTPQQIESEWISKAVQLGTPDTIKEIMGLLDAGFRKETEADGYQIFRKPK
jgi:integrase